jgi:hypothetical protein
MVTVTRGLSEHGNTGGVKGEASDMRTCYACGEKGHVRAHCRKRSAECYKCKERGHISSVCRKPRGGARSGGEDRKEFAGVAFTAWPKEARAPVGVWLVDSGSPFQAKIFSPASVALLIANKFALAPGTCQTSFNVIMLTPFCVSHSKTTLPIPRAAKAFPPSPSILCGRASLS